MEQQEEVSKHRHPGVPIEVKILTWGGVIVGIIWFFDQAAGFLL